MQFCWLFYCLCFSHEEISFYCHGFCCDLSLLDFNSSIRTWQVSYPFFFYCKFSFGQVIAVKITAIYQLSCFVKWTLLFPLFLQCESANGLSCVCLSVQATSRLTHPPLFSRWFVFSFISVGTNKLLINKRTF